MDYRYFRAFILTARHLNFSKAARILGIAQSAVSRQIKLLEESLGEELIIRSSRRVLLTASGQELYAISRDFDQMALEIFKKEDTRSIEVGILHGVLENWFNSILIKFYKKYTRNIHIIVDTPPNLKKGIEEGKFDLVFTTENIQSELVSSLNIFDEKLILISKKEIQLDQLHTYRWITYGLNDNIYRLGKKKSEMIISVESITSIVNLVKNNVGIAVVPDHVLRKNDLLKCYDLDNLSRSKIYMTSLSYKSFPRYIKELSQFIKV